MRMMAIGLGLLIPLVILLIRENMNTKVRGRTDIDKLTIPFIGEIPQYGKHKPHSKLAQLFRSKKKKKGEEESLDILVKPKSRNVINEAFRVVRTNMDFIAGADRANKVIMFTSINPGSGKTFLSVNIASSFAIKGNRTIAVDLDLGHLDERQRLVLGLIVADTVDNHSVDLLPLVDGEGCRVGYGRAVGGAQLVALAGHGACLGTA
jgi:hypothetical protein